MASHVIHALSSDSDCGMILFGSFILPVAYKELHLGISVHPMKYLESDVILLVLVVEYYNV